MPDASYLQSSFLGGEWSPLVQGRMDRQDYRTGLNVCRNGIPIEEGSWTRRPGTRYVSATRSGRKAVLRSFHFAQGRPYNIELTQNHLRLMAGPGLVVNSSEQNMVTAVSGNPGAITTGAAHGWATNDQVQFHIDPGDLLANTPNTTLAPLLGRELAITVTSTTAFTVYDPLTGQGIDCSSVVLGSSVLTVVRVSDFATNYSEEDLQAVNIVQGQTNALGNFAMLLHNSYQPAALTNTVVEYGTTNAAFSWNSAVSFLDGPYLDEPVVNGQPDGSLITPSATTGSVTLTLTQGTTGPVFKSTDVGRSVRLFSEPATWASGTAYVVGDQVKYNGAYYQALKAQTGKQPDVDVVNWAVSPNAAVWVWATITAYTDATHVTATLKPVVANGTTGPDLPRTTACRFRLGTYSTTTGWPACGVYHEGRLWLAGAVANRFDASVSNDPFNFTPTAADGTVADNNGISGTFNAKASNAIFWMIPDERGIIAGSQEGEWIISASQTNDPITPTSIQAHQKTTYGCANTPAFRAGLAITFVQRFNKKVLEYITTDFRGLTAKNISVTGKHLLTKSGVAEIAYTREKTPVLWARTNDGGLVSCSYKRESAYASDPPDMAGWARHDLGAGMIVNSIAAGPNYDGSLDTLMAVVYDGSYYYNVFVSDYFDVDWTIGDSLFVDFATTPPLYQLLPNSTSPTSLKLYALWRLAGKTVDVMISGVDCGSLTVGADGTLTIAIDGSLNALLTQAWVSSLSSASNFHGLGLDFLITPAAVTAPALTGITTLNVSGYSQYSTPIDWDRKRMLTLYNGLTIQDLVTRRPVANYPDISAYWNLSFPAVVMSDGGIATWAGGNNGTWRVWDGKQFKLISQFGSGAGSQLQTDASHSGAPIRSQRVTAGDIDFVMTHNLSINEITFIALAGPGGSFFTPFWCGTNFALDEGKADTICHGRRTYTTVGEGFAMAHSYTQLGLYRYMIAPNGSVVQTKLPKLTPAQLYPAGGNPAWTHIDSVGDLLFDETDNTMILSASSLALAAWSSGTTYAIGNSASSLGHDFMSKTNSNLNNAPAIGGNANWTDLGVSSLTGTTLVKVDTTGAVKWVYKDNAPMTFDSRCGWGESRVRHGTFCYLAPWTNGFEIVTINTVTGAATIGAQVANNTIGPYMFDDTTGQLILTFQPNGQFDPLVPMFGFANPSGIVGGWMTLGPASGHVFYPAVTAPASTYWQVPAAIGYGYASQGQILRPIHPQEAGAANGPALGKTRRSHQLAALLQQTQGISFGTDFTKVHTAELKTKGGTNYALTALYSGVQWGALEDDYSFDSMVCWQVTRPYPATVCALGPFLHTQDR